MCIEEGVPLGRAAGQVCTRTPAALEPRRRDQERGRCLHPHGPHRGSLQNPGLGSEIHAVSTQNQTAFSRLLSLTTQLFSPSLDSHPIPSLFLQIAKAMLLSWENTSGAGRQAAAAAGAAAALAPKTPANHCGRDSSRYPPSVPASSQETRAAA